MLQSIDPATGAEIRAYPEADAGKIKTALNLAATTFERWSRTSWEERRSRMRGAAALLRERAPEYARLMAAEMGKPLAAGAAPRPRSAPGSATTTPSTPSASSPPSRWRRDAARSYVAFRPLGVVLAVMPWNFPFWQVFRFAAPGLMAGNAGLLKHASNVSGCALAIEDGVPRRGVPRGTSSRRSSPDRRAVEADDRPPAVSAVTLTGSTPAGRAVAAAAGRALKKTVLELGGSDPYVVLEDADLERAAETCVDGRLINSGQSCIAAKRFIVVDAVRAEFTERFVAGMRAKRMGDPRDRASDLGPHGAPRPARRAAPPGRRERRPRRARCLLGGEIPPGRAPIYPPTVLADVRPGMPAYDEELFGPVGALIEARDEDEAIRIANDSPFGLGAAVFTRDAARGERIAAERLEAGACFVNAFVQLRPAPPLRRHQGIGLRPRARRVRNPRVRERQDRLRGMKTAPRRAAAP